MTDIRFTDLTLTESLLSALEQMGYEHPTPVQASAIPLATAGRDLMVQSQTGTGKTAAFGIPLIEGLEESKGIQALVLCPTRELAKQVADEFTRIGQFKKVQPVAVYGGASIEKQIAELKFSQVVVGTPGRVLDHLKRGTAKFGNVKTLVLDEADEMLSMGFAQELEQIMRFIPKERQTLLFSATIPPDIKRYAKRYMNEPEFLSLVEENVAADDVDHQYYMVSGVGRSRDLVRVIEFEEPKSAIIFTNTRKDCEVVARALKRAGFGAEYLNGDLPQRERERVLGLMKDKAVPFLVATDIAARGIDISQLSHVINYQLPESAEVYIHRTGRTGRAGASGTAISLIGPREIGVYYYLKRIYKVALEERTVPSKTEIDLRRSEVKIESLVEQLVSSIKTEEIDPALKAQAARLLERENAADLVEILLAHFSRRKELAPKQSANVGGVLKDVPKPEHVAPGGRRATLAGIADRVATIRGEYRGLPADSKKAETEEPADDKSAAKASPAKASSAEEESPAKRPRRTRSRRTAEPEAKAVEQAEPKATEDDSAAEEAPRKTRRSARKASEAVTQTSEEDRPRRTRRTSRKKQEEALETEAAAQTDENEASAPVDEESTESRPRRARRGSARSRLKAKLSEESGASESDGAPAEEEEKPKRTRRSARRTAEATEQDAKPEATKADEKPEAKTRGRRRRDDDDDSRRPAPVPEGMKRLYVNVGKRSRVEESDLRDEIAELAGLLPEDLVEVDVYARHSFITVEDDFAEDLLEAVNGESLRGRTIRIEYARD